MKVIITESQFNSRVRERLIDSLVDKTEVSYIKPMKGDKHKYYGYIKFPFNEHPFNISFNDSNDYTFGFPALINLHNWFLMVGVDTDKSFKEAEELRSFYLDKLEVKLKGIIDNYLNK
jgi:hypothetical protein